MSDLGWFKYKTLEQVNGMRFDVVAGNPPFNDTDTHHESGFRKQGKNLSKQFFEVSLGLAKSHVVLIASYSQRTYSKSAQNLYMKHGLYKIENCQQHFPDIKANCATFYFNVACPSTHVIDDCEIKEIVPEKNLSEICFPRATHNGLAREQYEKKLKNSGKTKVVLTTSIQKYASDDKLISSMGDRTRGYWRIVFNKVSDRKGTGKLIIAGPDDLLTQNVGCFVVNSLAQAKQLKEFLELPKIQAKIGSLKVSNANSKNVFKYIENPLI
jgi:hypothetical protein